MLFEFKPLFEKNGLTDFQKVLLSDTFMTFILLKYFSLVWRYNFWQKFLCFL